MPFERIVLLAGKWDTTPIVYHFLEEHMGVHGFIMEESVSKKEFLKKRIKKLGWLSVGGQLLFQLLVAKPLRRLSQKRIEEIKKEYGLKDAALETGKAQAVSSVNSEDCLRLLQELQPDLVIVHGTRIISKKILQGINAPFINIHAGITPRYRGSHGAYWALANGDPAHCGVTVHFVDAGIDTGNILAQKKIPVSRKDNFVTYPYIQLAEGLNLLQKVVGELERGERPVVSNQLNSALWHHPTIWGYWYKRITKGVK